MKTFTQTYRIVGCTVVACVLYGISAGLRANFGLLMQPVIESSGLLYEQVSLVMAVGQIVFGAAQPAFGVLAMRTSNRSILITGALLMAAGLLCLPLCTSFWSLLIALGVLVSAGTGGISFGILVSAVTLKVGEAAAEKASGFVNAGSGVGATGLSLGIQAAIGLGGLVGAVMFLTVPALLAIPLSLWLGASRPTSHGQEPASTSLPLRRLFGEALRNRSYILLMVGFFTCGFHMAIIETHLFSQMTSYGITPELAAALYSSYGIAIIVGSIASGLLCARLQMRRLLGGIYAARVLIVLVFLLAPKNPATIALFAVALGLTADATVAPTSGLTLAVFGPQKLAALFGLIFFAHQVGSFASAWLGGLVVAQTGGYTALWLLSMALSAVAAIASFRIPAKA